jgi:hypothetical protein
LTEQYRNLVWPRDLPDAPPLGAVMARAAEAQAAIGLQAGDHAAMPRRSASRSARIATDDDKSAIPCGQRAGTAGTPSTAFCFRVCRHGPLVDLCNAVLNSAVLALQRTAGAKVRLAFLLKAEAPDFLSTERWRRAVQGSSSSRQARPGSADDRDIRPPNSAGGSDAQPMLVETLPRVDPK